MRNLMAKVVEFGKGWEEEVGGVEERQLER